MSQDARSKSYATWQAEAETIEAGFRRALEELAQRDDLSPKGKAEARPGAPGRQ